VVTSYTFTVLGAVVAEALIEITKFSVGFLQVNNKLVIHANPKIRKRLFDLFMFLILFGLF
jgi:hypothetical protein